MLSELHFQNFRGFRDLSLKGLNRVNLIVGKNNSGKTSLLEGIAVLLQPTTAGTRLPEFRQLESYLRGHYNGPYYDSLLLNDLGMHDEVHLSGMWNGQNREFRLGLTGKRNNEWQLMPMIYKESDLNFTQNQHLKELQKIEDVEFCVLSTISRTPDQLMLSLGEALNKKDGEEILERTLQKVDCRIKKLRIIPFQNKTQIRIDIGLENLTPISQVGQGIYRLVEIFSEVIGSDAKVAFIDEIENGIHHSSLVDLWRGIAESSTQYDTQIFASTHSYECIEAAHEAFSASKDYDLSIIQLFRESEKIQGRVLDQKHIEAAIAGEIDLRG